MTFTIRRYGERNDGIFRQKSYRCRLFVVFQKNLKIALSQNFKKVYTSAPLGKGLNSTLIKKPEHGCSFSNSFLFAIVIASDSNGGEL